MKLWHTEKPEQFVPLSNVDDIRARLNEVDNRVEMLKHNFCNQQIQIEKLKNEFDERSLKKQLADFLAYGQTDNIKADVESILSIIENNVKEEKE